MVVQRAGAEVNGGAEHLCLELAAQMSGRWQASILTTTAIDHLTWAPAYAAGMEKIGDVTVHRFDVDRPRDIARFDQLSRRIRTLRRFASRRDQEGWMQAQGPYSTELLRFIEDHRDDYDAFFFFTYLYAHTYFGLPLVAEKAILVPFAHEEWMIALPFWNTFFAKPKRIVFSTLEERELLRRRFPSLPMDGPIIGIGVSCPEKSRGERFRERFGIHNPYMLYLGRVDRAKGIEQLLLDFARYKSSLRADDALDLVLVGRATMPVPTRPDLHAVGFVDEELKFDALSGCELLVAPSSFESLSIALLEAWSMRKPALVNSESDVLVGQSRRANAGLSYRDSEEFGVATDALRSGLGRQLGENGYAFVQREYAWATVREKYADLVDEVADHR